MRKSFCILLLLPLIVSCNEKPGVNLEEDRKKILELHHLQRAYHFGKDSVSFANQLSDEFISVSKGEIRKPTRQETVSRYHGYFSSVEFLAWDDVREPIIRFSEDGTLAYTIVEKIVKLTYDGEDGMPIEDETHFAWTAIYRKYGEQWKIDCVTSTEMPVKE